MRALHFVQARVALESEAVKDLASLGEAQLVRLMVGDIKGIVVKECKYYTDLHSIYTACLYRDNDIILNMDFQYKKEYRGMRTWSARDNQIEAGDCRVTTWGTFGRRKTYATFDNNPISVHFDNDSLEHVSRVLKNAGVYSRMQQSMDNIVDSKDD